MLLVIIILISLCLFICLFMYFLNYFNNLEKIDDFNEVLKKEDIYSNENAISQVLEEYLSVYNFFSKRKFNSAKVKKFITKYNSLGIKKDILVKNNERNIEIAKFVVFKNDKVKKLYDFYIEKAGSFISRTEEYKLNYFTSTQKNELLEEFKDTFQFFEKNSFSNTNIEPIHHFFKTYSDLNRNVKLWNDAYINNELKKYKDFFDNIDGKSLDFQQRKAVVTDDTNSLVIAGAGSGKTLTIAAKVKYLVECKGVNPKDILLISFTRKSAKEMTDRISNNLGIPIQAVTFHKLGFDILKLNSSNICDNLSGIISSYFKEKIVNDDEQVEKILHFFLYYLNEPKDLSDFETLSDYIDTQSTADLTTLKSKYNFQLLNSKINDMKKSLDTIKGERVKSTEEAIIANFLFMNGINYEYEKEYPYKPENNKRAMRPDFYLTDYDIYLEHFGITEDGRLPWLSKKEEEKYLYDMEWKRNFHIKNGTKLIETYSYYNHNGELPYKLKKLLEENNVVLKPINILDVYKKVYAENEDYHFKEFEKLIQTFIQLFKANGYSYDDFYKLYRTSLNSFDTQRNLAFCEIVKPILKYYQDTLNSEKKIDYNDMINLSTKHIKETIAEFTYKYIIIDEYQDISLGRYKLIKSIIDKTSAKLFCVGDDWQSIYRFSGSDLTLFTNFEKYFGETNVLKIEKTYRNSQALLNIAKKFVELNPEQIKKNLNSSVVLQNPIKAMIYLKDPKQALDAAIRDIYNNFGNDSDILLLGRTKYDINNFLSNILIYNPNTDEVKYRTYPDIKMKFLTVHSSKGLEADNVIILNMENTLLGFPNKIADDNVLSMVLQNKDTYTYAEERRLFYVAITRTKNRTYLIVPDKRQSIFYKDLRKISNIPQESVEYSNSTIENPECPYCGKGRLVVREANGKSFLGCTNYPYCNHTINDTSILYTKTRCPKCGGYLVKRKGKYGVFYGCSNYRTEGPSCDYKTKSIKKESITLNISDLSKIIKKGK
mgnify:FL=1